MSISMHSTKLVIRDLDAAERFYSAIGWKVVRHTLGGEGEFRMQQCMLSETGDASSHLLILTRFVNLPQPPTPVYPGESWLMFNVSDVDAIVTAITTAGGKIVSAAEDQPKFGVRAAILSDPEGHHIEVVGPMNGR